MSTRGSHNPALARARKGETEAVHVEWDVWAPTFKTAFMLLAVIRTAAACVNIIADCDETYNYWEPTHYLLYGFGFQTWEYSPAYALRSYAYLLPHAAIGYVLDLLHDGNKPLVFTSMRIALGFISAACEAYLYRGVVRAFGRRTGRYCLLLLALTAGMFHAATTFLPSTFAMYCVSVAVGAWLRDRVELALLAASCGVLLGWPFVALALLPLGFDALARHGVKLTAAYGILSLLLFLLPSFFVDRHFYRRPLLAVLNIVLYNALPAAGRGDELYGTEPWTYYPTNLLLNFNLAALLAVLGLLTLPTVPAPHSWRRRVLYLSPLVIWLAVMQARPHKEERFLFVVYPLLIVAAASGLAACRGFAARCMLMLDQRLHRASRIVSIGLLIAITLLSAARCAAIMTNYGAPMHLYTHLHERLAPRVANTPRIATEQTALPSITVCTGKEWHRFPNSFFLPAPAVQLAFVPSAFRGQLPAPFQRGRNGTWVLPPHMNDMNREEPSRYVDRQSACDYFVDFESPAQVEPKLSEDAEWEVVWQGKFLESSRSPSLARAFHFPAYSHARNAYGNYVLLRRRGRGLP